jgi:formate dehydrogenase subunit gamma
MIFWLSLFGGIAVIASGLLLLFPFYVTDIAGMQIAQVIHALVAVLFIALILAHVYTGTLAIEGAFEAMGTGEVDLNWAKEHHDLWLAELAAKRTVEVPGPSAEPSK